jgi:hypothetical protein
MPKNFVNAVLKSKPGREFCQLRPTFPDKPLLKHHVALCESCRFIAPVQLLFLEIFKFVGTFKSFVILKMLNGMGFEPGDVVTAPWCAPVRSRHAGHMSNL